MAVCAAATSGTGGGDLGACKGRGGRLGGDGAGLLRARGVGTRWPSELGGHTSRGASSAMEVEGARARAASAAAPRLPSSCVRAVGGWVCRVPAKRPPKPWISGGLPRLVVFHSPWFRTLPWGHQGEGCALLNPPPCCQPFPVGEGKGCPSDIRRLHLQIKPWEGGAGEFRQEKKQNQIHCNTKMLAIPRRV